MDAMMMVMLLDGLEHEMRVEDVLCLTRGTGPLYLPVLHSPDHFKRFQTFVTRQEEELKQGQLPSVSLNQNRIMPPQPQMSPWKREFLDEINSWTVLDAWMRLAESTGQEELDRLLQIRSQELEELGVVEEDDDESSIGNGDDGGDEVNNVNGDNGGDEGNNINGDDGGDGDNLHWFGGSDEWWENLDGL